jgi:hypothetical protein
MAVKHLLAAVHIERRMAVAMQGAQSGDLLASVVASWLPAAFIEKLQQRNARLEGVVS